MSKRINVTFIGNIGSGKTTMTKKLVARNSELFEGSYEDFSGNSMLKKFYIQRWKTLQLI